MGRTGDPAPVTVWHHGGVVLAPPIPLVWAKLQPPRLPPGVVVRATLLDRLARPGAALTAIVAPAGYGKTTVAAQLAERLDGPTAWLSLEPADGEPVRFWTYVAAALGAAGVSGADGAYDLLGAGIGGVGPTSLALRSAIEADGKPVTLVLDDLQAIDDAAVEATIGEWLRHPVANLRLVAASRRDLPLPVGRLRSLGLLSEARVDQLAFDCDESAALLATTFGLAELSEAQMAALDRRTEGWPVGLYLAGLTLRDEPDMAAGLRRFTGDTRQLNEYLAVEAMDGLTDDARAFVLATSILDVLHPGLCDAVTDGVGSLRQLRQLAADNVFTVALDDGATTFQYHPLFREHLRSALVERHPEQLPDLHARASAWFEAEGDGPNAIGHATAAGHLDRAEDLVLEHFLAFVNAGHFGTVVAWVDALGPWDDRRSETAMAMAWLTLNLRRYEELDRWLEIAAVNVDHQAERALVAAHGPSILVHRARHQGDVGAMVIHAEAAMAADAELGTDVDDRALSFIDEGRVAVRSAAASAAFWSGDHDRSRELALSSMTRAGTGQLVSIERVFSYGYLALIEVEGGDPEAALAHADQALVLVDDSRESTHLPALAHLARSMALGAMGRPGDAAAALDDARRVAAYRAEPLHDALIELHQARLHHQAGDQEAARAAVRTATELVADLPDARFDHRIRAVENTIRFVARDPAALPVGARELTDRELAVLGLLPHGMSRRELARQLHVSENTVKSHLTSIRHKLGVVGRESIVDRAVELGLLPDAPDGATWPLTTSAPSPQASKASRVAAFSSSLNSSNGARTRPPIWPSSSCQYFWWAWGFSAGRVPLRAARTGSRLALMALASSWRPSNAAWV